MWSLLRSRTRSAAGLPMVAYADVTTGERVELSAASVENAAAKVANALRDEFGLDPGAVVSLHLPAHWQRAAWCAGAWTAGCRVSLGPTGGHTGRPDLVVCGPSEAEQLTALGDLAVVSLHPFGLPLTDALPAGAVDVTLAVRQQPDAYLFDPPSGNSPALDVGDRVLDQDEVLALAADLARDWGLEAGGRLLADDAVDGLPAWLAAFAVPLVTGASVVLVRGDGRAVAEQERVTARAG